MLKHTTVAAKWRLLEKEEYYASLLERQGGTLLPLCYVYVSLCRQHLMSWC